MKPLIFTVIFVGLLLIPTRAGEEAQNFDHNHGLYDRLLKKHVQEGKVTYAALKSDPKTLEQYLDQLAAISQQSFKAWKEPRQLAFLFNLYNAATLKVIVDHYPIRSIKEITREDKGPWDLPVVRLFGKTLSLNELEHETLRKQYNEPRLHLALVCAARGCPPLRSEAYTGQRLNAQLDDQARRFLGKPAHFRIDREKKTVYFSAIFDWYGDDFKERYTPTDGFPGLDPKPRAVARYCADFVGKGDRVYLEKGGFEVRYLDYDWALNIEIIESLD